MKITFISSFVPRKCGIATYTRDLSFEIKELNNEFFVTAMDNPAISVEYSKPVTQIVSQDILEDYKKASQAINGSSTDIVHLQHEFGLFGGPDGDYILELARILKKPLVTTFHTILLTPTEHQKYIIQELTRLSRGVTVMEETAKYRLENVYGLNAGDISVIPHGAPVILIKREDAKNKIGYSDSFLLLANNLLSRNKGIEYAIEATGKALKAIPNLVFLIVGETHPVVKSHEGEAYREELRQLINKLGLKKQVVLKNKYVTLDELKTLLAAADVYVTPYLDPQQVTSGTLAYAIGADKTCIATEYVYAKEMLSHGRGILVPFKNSNAIAKALIDLYKHPKKRESIEKRAIQLRNDMRWDKIGKKHVELYQHIITAEKTISKTVLEFLKKPINISYLSHMTDSVGMMQHAHHTIPDRRYGYSTDDNARAFIIASQFSGSLKKEATTFLKTYLSFLQFSQEQDGRVHTFLNFRRNWDDQGDVADAYGKIMWALGFYLFSNPNGPFAKSVHTLFVTGLEQIDNVTDLRTASYTILGLHYYLLIFEGRTDYAFEVKKALEKLADYLAKNHKKASEHNWDWFEEKITYDNFRLPQALLAAYLITKNKKYKKIALTTLDFITDCNSDFEKKYFDFIGQNGWYKKGEKRQEYDQQPLEADGAVEAFIFAYKATRVKKYKEKALLAFEWFFGRNRNHRFMYDKDTKGVYDGLNLRGVSQNEGAESLVCFLMANLMLKNFLEKVEN